MLDNGQKAALAEAFDQLLHNDNLDEANNYCEDSFTYTIISIRRLTKLSYDVFISESSKFSGATYDIVNNHMGETSLLALLD